LEKEGYAWGTTILGSEVVGTPHPRPRSWIVACNDYPYGDGDTGEGVEAGKLSDNLKRAFEENNKQGNYWKRQLGTGNDGKDGLAEQSQSAAYSRGVRAIYGDTYWVDQVKCCGNSVVWIVPAIIGSFAGQGRDSGV
jgi:site-specific DNA-cytosine methylase